MVFIMIRFIFSSNYPLTCFSFFFFIGGPVSFDLLIFLEASKNSPFIYEESKPQQIEAATPQQL